MPPDSHSNVRGAQSQRDKPAPVSARSAAPGSGGGDPRGGTVLSTCGGARRLLAPAGVESCGMPQHPRAGSCSWCVGLPPEPGGRAVGEIARRFRPWSRNSRHPLSPYSPSDPTIFRASFSFQQEGTLTCAPTRTPAIEVRTIHYAHTAQHPLHHDGTTTGTLNAEIRGPNTKW